MNKHFPGGWDLDDRMTIVLFAGMGGGCDGLEDAGFHVHVAINHDPVAVAVHEKRHPHTQHLRCDVFEADPRQVTKGRGVRALHASPDCTHFSVAKGSKPVSKRRRSLAWVICRWLGTVSPELVTLENVREIQTWGPLIAKRDPATGRVIKLDDTVAAEGERVPVQEQQLVPDPRHKGRIWKDFVKHIEGLGYGFEWRVLNCADYGLPTIRTRLFGVMRRDGGEIHWPARTHAPRDKCKEFGLKPWVGAYTIIDWSRPVKSIFGRKKPLAEATLRRTARGVMRYVVAAAKPFIAPITHAGDDRVHSLDDPLRTLTTAHRGEMSVVVPHVAKFRTGATGSDILEPLPTFTANSFEKRPGGAVPLGLVGATIVGAGGRAAQTLPQDLDLPLNTSSTKEDRVLVAAHLEKFNQNGDGTMPDEPLGTLMAGAPRHAVVSASLVALAHGDSKTGGNVRESGLDEPLKTIHAGGGNEALVAAFLAQHSAGSHPGQPAKDLLDPVPTLTSAGSQQGLAAVALGDMHGTSEAGRTIGEPLATIAASGNHAHLILAFLQHYFSNGKQGQSVVDPLGALTAKARYGLVEVMVDKVAHFIADIGIRMLEPEEGAAAHGFKPGALPSEITIDGKSRRLTKTEKYHLVGNSVPPWMVQLLVEANGRRELEAAYRVAAE